MPHTKKPTLELPSFSMIYRRIAISFVVLTVILIGIIAFFSVMTATVVVTPKAELRSAEFLVTLRGTGSGAASLPEAIAGTYEEKNVEQEDQFESSGRSEKLGLTQGVVTLINTTPVPQPLVATTRLLSPSGVLLRIQKNVTVPAQGQVEVEARADKEGSEADLGPTRFTIPGLRPEKQKLIYAEIRAPLQGAALEARTVSGDDLEQAKGKLLEQALAKVKETAVSEKYGAQGLTVSHEILDFKTSAKKGEATLTFTGRLKIKAQLLRYDARALQDLAFKKVQEAIPPDREIVKFNKEALLLRVKNVQPDGAVQVAVYADAQVRLIAQSPILDPVKLAGMLPAEAENYLQSFDAIEKAEVRLFPSWQKQIPNITNRIKIVVKK